MDRTNLPAWASPSHPSSCEPYRAFVNQYMAMVALSLLAFLLPFHLHDLRPILWMRHTILCECICLSIGTYGLMSLLVSGYAGAFLDHNGDRCSHLILKIVAVLLENLLELVKACCMLLVYMTKNRSLLVLVLLLVYMTYDRIKDAALKVYGLVQRIMDLQELFKTQIKHLEAKILQLERLRRNTYDVIESLVELLDIQKEDTQKALDACEAAKEESLSGTSTLLEYRTDELDNLRINNGELWDELLAANTTITTLQKGNNSTSSTGNASMIATENINLKKRIVDLEKANQDGRTELQGAQEAARAEIEELRNRIAATNSKQKADQATQTTVSVSADTATAEVQAMRTQIGELVQKEQATRDRCAHLVTQHEATLSVNHVLLAQKQTIEERILVLQSDQASSANELQALREQLSHQNHEHQTTLASNHAAAAELEIRSQKIASLESTAAELKSQLIVAQDNSNALDIQMTSRIDTHRRLEVTMNEASERYNAAQAELKDLKSQFMQMQQAGNTLSAEKAALEDRLQLAERTAAAQEAEIAHLRTNLENNTTRPAVSNAASTPAPQLTLRPTVSQGPATPSAPSFQAAAGPSSTFTPAATTATYNNIEGASSPITAPPAPSALLQDLSSRLKREMNADKVQLLTQDCYGQGQEDVMNSQVMRRFGGDMRWLFKNLDTSYKQCDDAWECLAPARQGQDLALIQIFWLRLVNRQLGMVLNNSNPQEVSRNDWSDIYADLENLLTEKIYQKADGSLTTITKILVDDWCPSPLDHATIRALVENLTQRLLHCEHLFVFGKGEPDKKVWSDPVKQEPAASTEEEQFSTTMKQLIDAYTAAKLSSRKIAAPRRRR